VVAPPAQPGIPAPEPEAGFFAWIETALSAAPAQPTNARAAAPAANTGMPSRAVVTRFYFDEGVAGMIEPAPVRNGAILAITDTGETVPWKKDPTLTKTPTQIVLGLEDYIKLEGRVKESSPVSLQVDIKNTYQNMDQTAFNVVGEIKGTDKATELVVVGAHLDTVHLGKGATDNAAGVAVVMEAVRLLKVLALPMRRTVQIGLWTGEEQGLLGSKAYVTQHFGRFVTNTTEVASSTRSPRDEGEGDGRPNRRARSNRSDSGRKVAKEEEYDKLSAYFNLDNGAGKIRGIYMQGNEAVRPYFRKWLEPFRDLGAETITPSNTGSTDHISFTTIGLPGFQFLHSRLEGRDLASQLISSRLSFLCDRQLRSDEETSECDDPSDVTFQNLLLRLR